MHQVENILPVNNEIPVPELSVDAWAEEMPGGGVKEKGVTLRWTLPEGIDAMMVEVDGATWGPYLDPGKTLNIAYTDDPDRQVAGDPVRVRLYYLKFGPTLQLNVLPLDDEITLVLDDIVLMRNLGSQEDDFCPAAKYPTPVSPVFSGTYGYWEIKYSDKYSSNGAYRAIRITISKSGTTVSCVVRPDAAGGGIDGFLTNLACSSDLQGSFTEQEDEEQKYVQTTDFTGSTLSMRTFRDTDQDQVVIRIFGIDSTFTVGARLHENS